MKEEVLTIMKERDFDEVYSWFRETTFIKTPRRNASSLLLTTLNQNEFVIKDDPDRVNVIRRVIAPLLKLFHRKTIKILILNTDEIGAYYLSGVALGFTIGLLDNIKNYNELLGVTAHELSHQMFSLLSFEAQLSKCSKSFRQIELLCDGMATLALNKINESAQGLVNVLARTAQRESFYHPATKDRIELINILRK